MVYSYGLFGKNNRPYNDYYLNCRYRSVYSKEKILKERMWTIWILFTNYGKT